MEPYDSRPASHADIPEIRLLMAAAIDELQRPFLDTAQIEASRAIMGLDTQLIDDGTYFVVLADDQIVGCGGWSYRRTLYGGDATAGRDAAMLRPGTDPAKIRAMYTRPGWERRGIGTVILSLCAEAARAAGFDEVELMATLSGAALYAARGFEAFEETTDTRSGIAVPLVKMRKRLVAPQASSSASQ